jgi:glutamine synthetase
LPVLMTDTETGPGVYETALAYTDARKMADNTALYKLVAKSVGYKYGILPTFMAKPYSDVSGHISSLQQTLTSSNQGAPGKARCRFPLRAADNRHIHVSLRDSNGKNAFALSSEEIKAGGRANAYHEQLKFISQDAEHFLAGLIDGLQDGMSSIRFAPTGIALIPVMPLFCPTINSYKRLAGGAVSRQCHLPWRYKLTPRRTGPRTPRRTDTIPERRRSE